MIARTLILLSLIFSVSVFTGGGPLGIDHKIAYDGSGIFKRQTQKNLLALMMAGEVAGGIWEGDQSRLAVHRRHHPRKRLTCRDESGVHAVSANPDQ